jgi:glycosyltransferase involved in cell wall biosynthesis
MKIGMILDKEFPPDPRVQNEAKSLIENGHEVFLFCLGTKSAIAEEIIEGIKVKRYTTSKLMYKSSALAYDFPLYHQLIQKKIAHFLINNEIEVIHIHDLPVARAVFNSNKLIQLPVILDLHENRPEIMRYYSYVNSGFGKYLISIEKWKKAESKMVNRADGIFVVTEEAKAELAERCKIDQEKIVVVPNTVSRDFFEDVQIDDEIMNRFSNDFMVLYIGDTGLRRGLVSVIKSIPHVSSIIPNFKLVIVGSSSSDMELKKVVKDLKLENYVVFEGWQESNTFHSYIAASSICISPLLRNLHHDTTFANKIFQYMSQEKPILVSDCMAQKNIVEKVVCGKVHSDDDEIDIANKLIWMYHHQPEIHKMGIRGKAFVKNHFHWEITSKAMIDYYHKIKIIS